MIERDDESDDGYWVEGLAGRTDARAPASTRLEAHTLRKALEAHESRHAQAGLPADLAREARLLDRARVEGLLELHRPTPWRSWLAAAAIAGLAIGIGWPLLSSLPNGAPAVTERSGPAAPHQLEVEDALAFKRQLLAQLRAAGVDAQGYESLGVQGIDAELPQPLPDDVRQVLLKHGIPIPPEGQLQIEIVTREAPGKPR